MKVKIQVVIESDDGRVQDVEEVACLKRGMLTPEELGLNLAEAKQILQNVQQSMVRFQAAAYEAEQKQCRNAGEGGRRKAGMRLFSGPCSGNSNCRACGYITANAKRWRRRHLARWRNC